MPLFPAFTLPEAVPSAGLEPEAIVQTLRPFISVERRERIEQVIAQRLLGVTVVLEKPRDPHNGAAGLRSAEAMGLLDVHVIEGDDAFDFSRRVTRDAHKWLNVFLYRDTASCLLQLRRWGYALWAAAPPTVAGMPLGPEVRLDGKVALVFGNEHCGLSAQAFALCDQTFHVPMYGFSESFNLSVSVGLALQPVVRAYRRVVGLGDVPHCAVPRLRAAYYARCCAHTLPLLRRDAAEAGR